jgi:hypothetical protein
MKISFLQLQTWLGLYGITVLVADSCEIQKAQFKLFNFTQYQHCFVFFMDLLYKFIKLEGNIYIYIYSVKLYFDAPLNTTT